MVKLCDILDIDLLKKHLADGVVRGQSHPEYPSELTIWNYTEVAQFDRIWDPVTNICRGLITAGRPGDEIVIARPFRKFHNLNTEFVPETMEANLPSDIPLVTEKLDGSMGILYHWDNRWRVATRGSFASDQAKWATEFLQQTWQENFCAPPPNLLLTPIVEIIYPDNRIVVDYDYSGLVMTGMVWIEDGKEYSRLALEEWGRTHHLPVVKRFDKSLAECAGDNVPNAEGYVLSYPSTGLKVKVKFEEYCRLHRILTGLNPRSIWEMLVPPEMLMQQVPPEGVDPTLAEKRRLSVESILNDPKMPVGFIEWFSGWVTHLRSSYAELEKTAKTVFMMRPVSGSRRDIAEFFMQAPKHRGILFAMLDGKDYEPTIWKLLKPRGDISTYKRDGE